MVFPTMFSINGSSFAFFYVFSTIVLINVTVPSILQNATEHYNIRDFSLF